MDAKEALDLFSPRRVHRSQKLADKLMRQVEQEELGESLLALSTCLAIAANAHGIRQSFLTDIIETARRELRAGDGDPANAIQQTASGLILPGRYRQ